MKEGAMHLRATVPPFSFTEGWREQKEFEPSSLNYAEPTATETETLASQADAKGNPELASLLRGLAAEWRNKVNTLDDTVLHEEAIAASRALDILFGQAACHSELALDYLLDLATIILTGLHDLASNGYKGAADVLLASLRGATDQFNVLASNRPEFFLHRTRSAFGIPGVLSPYTEKTRDNAELVEVLEVGKDYAYPLATAGGGRGNKSKFATPSNYWARRLYAYVKEARDKVIRSASLAPDGLQQWVEAHPHLPPWMKNAVILDPLSHETLADWMAVIWEVLLGATDGRPEDEPILQPLGKMPAEHKRKYCKRTLKTTAKDHRNKIKQAIRDGLESLLQQLQQQEKARRAAVVAR